MPGFDELVQEISDARRKAAEFYKVDLHVHSHESPDFPKLGDKENCVPALTEEDHDVDPRDFIAAAKEVEDLAVIAITDHNLSRVACEISSLSDDDLLVLPGMEVTLQATIFPDSLVHVLAIFPRGLASEDIQQVFFNAGMPSYDRRTEGSAVEIPVDEFISRVHDKGGICIAGHVNSDRGVRSLFRDSNVRLLRAIMERKELERRERERDLSRQEKDQLGQLKTQVKTLEDNTQNRYLEFLSSYQFDAVEVQRSGDYQYYTGVHTGELGIRPIACLLGSDAHNLRDIGLEGSTTYVKMTEPGLRDLHRALLDPGARIRYEDTIQTSKPPRILGVRFRGGFFGDSCLGCSDNLTTLIGGRGTGKSAAIESLRYVFEHSLDHLPEEKIDDIANRQDHTLAGALIEVLFVDENNEALVVRRDYGSSQATCYALDGSARDEIDVAIASNLEIKVYGWGEIEELARDKREQLRLIDGFIPDIQSRIDAVELCCQNLVSNTKDIVSVAKRIEELLPRVAELPAKEAELERLSDDELDNIFTEFDQNEEAMSAVETFQTAIGNLSTRLKDEDEEVYRFEDEIKRSLNLAMTDLEGYEWRSEFGKAVTERAEGIQERYNLLLDQFGELETFVTKRLSLLKAERQSIESALRVEAEERDEDGFQNLVSRRKTLAESVSKLRGIQGSIDDNQSRIADLMKKRFESIIPKLQHHRRLLTKLRKRKIREINSRLEAVSSAATVSVTLRHQKEREPFRIALGAPDDGAPYGILKGINQWYKRDDYAGLYSKRHSPHTFVQAILYPGDLSSLRACSTDPEGNTREVITERRASEVANYLSPLLDPDLPYYDSEALESLLELEHADTQDLPVIRLDGKPIEDLSPGQRCSALIPIILLESRSPLVIDQPEDNLDNKLVFDLVVDILRSLKEKRQIIVATHNPNIPVSGDAEQIIALDTSSREECENVCQGSIDDEDIVDQIKAIMEGSEEAFRVRAEKYGYTLNTAPQESI
jgi:DNA repair ATPase RecN